MAKVWEMTRIDRAVSRKTYYLLLTVGFILLCPLVYFEFLRRGKSFVWDGDSVVQFLTGLVYLKRWVAEVVSSFVSGNPSIPMWDMSVGLGQDSLNVLSFRPLNYLSLLFPDDCLGLYTAFRYVLCMFLGAVSCSAFLHKLKLRYDISSLIGCYTYIFAGFSLCYLVKHAIFVELLFYYPWILLGIEKVLRGESFVPYVVGVALCGAAYFYNLYMIMLAGIVYGLIRFFVGERSVKTASVFGAMLVRFVLLTVLGMGLSAVSLLPNLMLATASNRSTANVATLVYDARYYAKAFAGVIGSTQFGTYGYLGFSALSVVCAGVGVSRSDAKAKSFKIALLVAVAALSFPVVSILMNGGAGITLRWSFTISLLAAVLVAFYLPELPCLGRTEMMTVAAVSIGYALLLVLLRLKEPSIVESARIEHLLIYVVACLLWGVGARAWQRIGHLALLLFFATELALCGYYAYAKGSLLEEFVDMDQVNERLTDSTAYGLAGVGNTERVDALGSIPWLYANDSNYGNRTGVSGLSMYYSYADGHIVEASRSLGLLQIHSPFRIGGFDQRPGLNSLAGVSTLTVPEGCESYVPYGYEYVGTTAQGALVYKNTYALPLVYAYEHKMSESEFNELDSQEKEQALLQAAVVSGDDSGSFSPEFDSIDLLGPDALADAVDVTNGTIEVVSSGLRVNEATTLEIQLPDMDTCQVDVLLEELYYRPLSPGGSTAGYVYLRVGDTKKMITLLGEGNQYNSGPRDVLANMGYGDFSGQTLTLYFSTPGYYDLGEFRVIGQPMEGFGQQIEVLQSNSASDVEISGNTVSASIDLDTSSVVCIAIPYSDGWSALVDGEHVDIEIVSGMYIGLELASGSHDITLIYSTPGLYSGGLLSAFSAVILVMLQVKSRIRANLGVLLEEKLADSRRGNARR